MTVSGHIATNEEISNHDDLTNPTIAQEKLVTFDAIQQKVFDIFQSGKGGSAIDNWLRAEQDLLHTS
jgi:hypothetical protein